MRPATGKVYFLAQAGLKVKFFYGRNKGLKPSGALALRVRFRV